MSYFPVSNTPSEKVAWRNKGVSDGRRLRPTRLSVPEEHRAVYLEGYRYGAKERRERG